MNANTRPCPRMLALKPPRIAMGLLLSALILHFAVPAFRANIPALPVAGLITSLCGCGIMLRAWWLFRQRATAICPTAATTVLITSDVYRLTRNPMYLGITMMLLGVSIGSGCVPCYIATLAFFLIMDYVFCPFEETKLGTAFGAEYARYQRAVRRWL